MTIEERVSKLEQDNQELKERVGMLSKREFATPSELADLLRCSKIIYTYKSDLVLFRLLQSVRLYASL